MDKRVLQTQLKGQLAQAEQLRTKNAQKGTWDEADAKEYERILGAADQTKLLISLVGREEEIQDWARSSNGKSAVKSGFGAGDDDEAEPSEETKNWRFSGPMEGVAEKTVGLTLEKGEMVATNKAGEAKLAILKSGLYKDAVNHYLRNGWKSGFSMKADAMKVLQEGQDSSGGAWVPPDFRQELNKKEATMAVIRPNALSFTTGSNLVSFPKVVYTTDDKYTSGVRFAWTAEAPSSDISESTNPVAGTTDIPIHTALAAIFLTRSQMEDNQFDLLGLVNQLLTEAFTLGNEDAFATGDSAGKPQGFTKHPNASVAHSGGGMLVLSGSAGAVAWGNSTTGVLGTEAALPPQYEGNSAWYASKATYAAIRALNAGTGNYPQWSFGDAFPNALNGMQASLLGWPARRSQFMPAIGSTATPLAYGDMKGYWIADRIGISIEVLREVKALRDMVVVYARQRLGGQLVQDWRLKLMKSNNS